MHDNIIKSLYFICHGLQIHERKNERGNKDEFLRVKYVS